MRVVLTWVGIGLVLLFVAGLWNFAERVRQPPAPPPQADAIVALTGGSLTRLSTGVRLLEERRGERLLISGVNRVVTDEELLRVALEVDPDLAECCIDIGRSAEDTLGNASETAAWAREHRYTKIILVTDDYHMPRSHAELSLAMPEAEIHPYPVRTRWTDPALWRSDLGAAGRLASEYVKYLVIRSREAVIDLGRGGETAKDGA
ncbi:MAG TPA: YdcF family protein [Vitreimonas sp.]|uniref:YdcF family protein n=1 Tax=Vitreimonas sp. TaxID=3069702 RepID=UPI002D41ED32|nr:YdcF family protein [Vitreimonas sp.]HYD89412.1 YdcF family protein [Vitreimonas sp.]